MAEDEHWLYVLLQNIPLTELQELVPHEQSTVLLDAPIWLGQALPPEQVLLEKSQKRPVVGLQAAAPQMQPALLAVVPSVSEQSGPVAQRQV